MKALDEHAPHRISLHRLWYEWPIAATLLAGIALGTTIYGLTTLMGSGDGILAPWRAGLLTSAAFLLLSDCHASASLLWARTGRTMHRVLVAYTNAVWWFVVMILAMGAMGDSVPPWIWLGGAILFGVMMFATGKPPTGAARTRLDRQFRPDASGRFAIWAAFVMPLLGIGLFLWDRTVDPRTGSNWIALVLLPFLAPVLTPVSDRLAVRLAGAGALVLAIVL
ncbi:hypothetical protein [Jannaschia sp. LMIT008]|uniref:hypothetical protein n=1 Tax=Jannaschia maritima TaxID=3032585 RepID=UPI0028116FA6|nr:hypothetical protein [Jannaschia sp. LMIT008]